MRRHKRSLEDLDQEIRDHIQHETRDNLERGMSLKEARLAALRKFGNITLAKEDTRAVWIPVWAEQLLQDARHGLRMLRRNPGFAAVVILTLALGIGMNTAVFSVFNAVLLRPLAYPDQDRLVWVSTQGGSIPFKMEAVARTDFVDWREQATSFERMVAYGTPDATIETADDAIRARIASVSDDFWEISGAHPVLGRLPQPGEGDAVLLSHGFFERWFHNDSNTVGRTVMINGRQVIITGVLPKGFLFQLPPTSWPGFDVSKDIDAYRPVILSPEDRVRAGRFGATTNVVAKLKPGVSIDRAKSELEAIRGRLRQANPKWFTNEATLRVIPLRDKLVGAARPALWVLLGAVVFVLLIACANIANLLLARSSARQKEIAIRAAMGAGLARVVRQFLVESTLLALLGGGAGLLLARWGLAIMLRLVSGAVPRLAETTIDSRVLVFALGVSILTACLFGVGPAISLWRTNLHSGLKDGARTSSATSGGLRTRSLLVAVELALAVVLLSGAGLMVKSFWRMNAHPAGFDPEHTLVMKVQHSGPQYGDVLRQRAYADEVLRGMQSMPGVQAASIISPDLRISLNWEGAPSPPDGLPPSAVFNVTSADFAHVMGIRVVKGRWITDAEPAAVIVINESLARRDFGGSDPLGKRTRLPGRPPSVATVVGVVADLKYSKLDAKPEPELYIPYSHTPDLSRMTLVVRTTGDSLAAAPAIRKVVSGIDKSQPAFDVMTLEQALADSIAPRRFNLFLLGTFAITALLLALIGIYGVIAYSVSRRTHEIGVRMALGAQRGEVVRMVVRQGMAISLVGIAIGILAATGLTRLMESLLYDVNPTDPQTFAAVASVLGVTALVACCGPAFKAAFVDPIIALRYE